MTASEAYGTALRLLAHHGRSEAELKEKLHRKGFAEKDTEKALQRCRELGYLDDVRFAAERARYLLRYGKAVGSRVLMDLKGRGIAEETALTAVMEAEDEFNPEEVLKDLAAKRFPHFRYDGADPKEKRRVIQFFQRRGFPLDMIFAYFRDQDADETSHAHR